MIAHLRHPALILAALGAVSGILGTTLLGVGYGDAPRPGVYMVMTGVWFGLVIGFAGVACLVGFDIKFGDLMSVGAVMRWSTAARASWSASATVSTANASDFAGDALSSARSMRANSTSCAASRWIARRTSRQQMFSVPSQIVWHCASRSWRAIGQSSM